MTDNSDHTTPNRADDISKSSRIIAEAAVEGMTLLAKLSKGRSAAARQRMSALDGMFNDMLREALELEEKSEIYAGLINALITAEQAIADKMTYQGKPLGSEVWAVNSARAVLTKALGVEYKQTYHCNEGQGA